MSNLNPYGYDWVSWGGRRKTWRDSCDAVFTADGQVKDLRWTGLAISMAAATGQTFTRQPTRERAEAVMDAVRERVSARGLTLELRHAESNDSWGVYVLAPSAEDAVTST